MTNEKRIKIEQRIVRKYIKAVLDAGFIVRASESGGMKLHDWTAKMPPNADIFACDDLVIQVRKKAEPTVPAGHLYFVFGNEPGEVLNDYTVNLEEIVAPINQYADAWA